MVDEGKADEIDAGESIAVSDQEMEAAYSGPAVASNRFFTTIGVGGAVRIAFAEQRSPNAIPVFRSAVILQMEDAIAFRNLLIRILREPEIALKRATSEAEAIVGSKPEVS